MLELPRGTVTLLFTDIEGSTRLLHELGRERYVEALEAHRWLLRETFQRHGGVEVEMQGDSFHFAFPRACDAVSAAAEGQLALARHEWGGPSIRVRIGIHTGEPAISGGLYAGLDVHRAARVMSVGHGSQILLSGQTVDFVAADLPADLSLRPLGSYMLKDFDRAEPLTQLVVPGLPETFPPLKAEREPSGFLRLVPRPIRRHPRAAAAALLVVAGAASAGFVLTEPSPGPTSNAVVAIDPQNDSISKRVAVGNSPTSVAVGNSAVWVVNAADATLSELGRSGKVLRTFGATGNPADVATTPGSVWLANRPNTILRIDPDSGDTTDTITLPKPATPFGPLIWLGSTPGAVWASALDRVSRVDAGTLRTRSLTLPTPDWGPIAITPDSIWMASQFTLYRLDRRGGKVLASLDFPQGPLVYAAGYVWAVNDTVDALAQIDPRTNTVVRTVSVGSGPSGVAFGYGSLWVASNDGTVTRIDPRSGQVVGTIRVGGSPQDVATGYGRVWVTVA